MLDYIGATLCQQSVIDLKFNLTIKVEHMVTICMRVVRNVWEVLLILYWRGQFLVLLISLNLFFNVPDVLRHVTGRWLSHWFWGGRLAWPGDWKMAERNQRMPDKSRVSRRGAKSRERPKNIEKSEHQLGPLTINTHLLDSFGLGPNYTDLQPIGFGANGLVVSAVNNSKKVKVAAKKIKIESQISCKYALREIRIMCKMQHDNIVRVLDVLHENGVSLNRSSGDGNAMPTDFSRVFLVQELLDTNLHVLITQKVLETDHVCLLFYQMLRGLHYLKSANIVHRDLKPSNLLINCDTLLLKIGDFGLARIIDPNYNHSVSLMWLFIHYWETINLWLCRLNRTLTGSHSLVHHIFLVILRNATT